MIYQLFRAGTNATFLINPLLAMLSHFKFSPTLTLCLATATHNFKRVKIAHTCLGDLKPQTFTNVDV